MLTQKLDYRQKKKIQIIGYGMKRNSRKLYNEMEMTQFLYVEEQ